MFTTSFFFFFLSSRAPLFHSFEQINFSINMPKPWKGFFPKKLPKNFICHIGHPKFWRTRMMKLWNNTHPTPFLKHHPFMIFQKNWNPPIHLCWSITLQEWWPFDKAIIVCHNVNGLYQHQVKAHAYWCGFQDQMNSCMGRLIFHGILDGGQLTYLWQDVYLPWTLFSSILFVCVIFISLQFFIIT